MTAYLDKQNAGLGGVIYETGTTALSSIDVAVIQCLTDTVFATLTNTLGSGDAITGVTLPAGTLLYGKFTAITLTSGAIAAYKSIPLN